MKLKFFLTGLLLLLSAGSLCAKDFFFGLTSYGSNLWFTPANAVVYLINNYALGGGSSSLGYDWVNIKSDNGADIDISNGNYFGFKARDMFNNFGGGLQIGYQPAYSIFGAWVQGGYKYRQFGMTLPDFEMESNRYKINAWYVGVGIRLTPFKALLEDKGWSPFVDFGTSYNAVFSAKTPFGKSTDQFGKGFATTFGLGVRFVNDYEENALNISVSFTLPQYNYFNRNYAIAQETLPFEHISAKNYSVHVKIQKEF